MRPEVRISDQLTEDAARLIADAAEAGSHIALTGGSTPKAAYARAAELGVDWSRCELWFGDERCVEPDHEHSNFKMARDSLLSKIEPRAVHRMQGELGPEDGALSYERELNGVFGDDAVPALELILLGLVLPELRLLGEKHQRSPAGRLALSPRDKQAKLELRKRA